MQKIWGLHQRHSRRIHPEYLLGQGEVEHHLGGVGLGSAPLALTLVAGHARADVAAVRVLALLVTIAPFFALVLVCSDRSEAYQDERDLEIY